jgi:phenylacetate-CoA ligase
MVLPDGEPGELVITSLTKEALPVIRYRTGDITALRPGTARTMRRLDRITGRSDDMLIIRGVNVYPSQVEAELLQVPGLAPHYQLHVGREGNLATLTITVERDPAGFAQDDASVARQAEARIKTMIGVTTSVRVVDPEAVPRSQGKAQRVTK